MTRSERVKLYFQWLRSARSERDLETKLTHIEQYFKNKENQDVPETIMNTYKRRLNQITHGM